MNSPAIPRPEYPRPQFVRTDWINLNGLWSFDFDFGKSGYARGLQFSCGFDREIVVPFCPESILSGIAYTDFMESIWYHRLLTIPQHWSGKQVLLHFGAVDFETDIYLDGKHIFTHYGGSSSFSVNLTQHLNFQSEQNLIVHVKDELRKARQTAGKQSLDYYSAGCFYTRVTGIWQTVWMEALMPGALSRCTLLSDIDSKNLHVRSEIYDPQKGSRLKLIAFDGDKKIAEVMTSALHGSTATIHFDEDLRLWSPESPYLYDLSLEILSENGEVLDSVSSYAGMRKIETNGNKFYLNNEPLYLRFVLDQGYYEDGIWTAPTDAALQEDIRLGQQAGFNGARLHQKVFEPRYHYWADTMGYLTWAESPSWGVNMKSDAAARNFLSEWQKIVVRDRNHPSIIAWTPLNETWDLTDSRRHSRLHIEAYELTKDLDPTRAVNGASGGCQVVTDIYAVHNYEQDPEKLFQMLHQQDDGSVYATLGDKEVEYTGQPYVVDEFGGIKWVPATDIAFASDSWGYGHPPQNIEEFYRRLLGQVDALLSLEHVAGYCYTQLTDVEQEQNGIYNYDRTLKFDMEQIRRIFYRMPASTSSLKALPHDAAHIKNNIKPIR